MILLTASDLNASDLKGDFLENTDVFLHKGLIQPASLLSVFSWGGITTSSSKLVNLACASLNSGLQQLWTQNTKELENFVVLWPQWHDHLIANEEFCKVSQPFGSKNAFL